MPPKAIPPKPSDRCPICGSRLILVDSTLWICSRCRGWRCNVCKAPAYRDESVHLGPFGKRHLRCSAGIPHLRPPWMQAIMQIGTKKTEEAPPDA